MGLTTADRASDPYEEQTQRAVSEAEQLRDELIRARLELELLERNRRHRPPGPASGPVPPQHADASPFGTLRGGQWTGTAVDGWAHRAGRAEVLDSRALAVGPSVQPRAARSRRSRRGLGTGIWFITFYFLLVALAQEAPDVPGSTPHQSTTSIVVGAVEIPGP